MSVAQADVDQVVRETPQPSAPRDEDQPLKARSTIPSAIWKTAVFFWKYVVAVALCQLFFGSILVVGWTYRLMQRTALKTW